MLGGWLLLLQLFALPDRTFCLTPVKPLTDADAHVTHLYSVLGGFATDSCRAELKHSTCDIDKADGVTCMTCITAHKAKIEQALVLKSACTAKKLDTFCHYIVTKSFTFAGDQGSNSCKMELMHSTCNIDQGDGQTCLTCISAHIAKIDQGLMKASECTAAKLHNFCSKIAKTKGAINAVNTKDQTVALVANTNSNVKLKVFAHRGDGATIRTKTKTKTRNTRKDATNSILLNENDESVISVIRIDCEMKGVIKSTFNSKMRRTLQVALAASTSNNT